MTDGWLHLNVDYLKHIRRRIFSRVRRLRSLDAYALWADSYPPVPHNRLMEIEQDAMLRLMPDLAGCRVLDAACGSGRYGILAAQNDATAIGTDNSIPMLKTGIKAGVMFPLLQSSLTELPFADAAFDVVVCALATGHLQPAQMRQAIAEMARVIRVKGSILVSDFHPAVYAKGRRRTFTAADGKQYEVEHYPHSLTDYEEAAGHVGLQISAMESPHTEMQGLSVPVILAMRFEQVA